MLTNPQVGMKVRYVKPAPSASLTIREEGQTHLDGQIGIIETVLETEAWCLSSLGALVRVRFETDFDHRYVYEVRCGTLRLSSPEEEARVEDLRRRQAHALKYL